MKNLLSILSVGLLMCGAVLTSCENYDDPVTGNAYGNNSIPEGRTITIAALKEKYNDFIDTSIDTYTTIEEETRIKGVIICDDESGNMYKKLVVADETGAIVIGINQTGLYAFCPVGQKVVIDCKGLQIGSYRKQAQIGTTYNNAVGRMPEYVWKQHVRLLNKPQLFYPELTPVELSVPADLEAIDKKEAPVLVTFKNMKFSEADGKETYAPGDDGSVKRYMNWADGSKCEAFLYTSAYANFAMEVMPQGSVDVTGVLIRYNNDWELIVRTLNDVKRNN